MRRRDRVRLLGSAGERPPIGSRLGACKLKGRSVDERFRPYVQVVSYKISRWFLLDGLFFARRDFGLKLRNYFPGKLAFDRKYVGNIPIVTFRPELAVRSRID